MVRRASESVFISNKTGWVRVFLSTEENYSTLVYVTDDNSIADVVENIGLQDTYTIWLQFYGGKKCYRLKSDEKPLSLQDEFLRHLGYADVCRRTRLGTDPQLANIIKFVIGPSSCIEINSCGYIYVLKGLVLPQWKKRLGVIIADKFFLYSQAGPANPSNYDVIPLSGASVKLEKSYKLNKHVLRVVTCKQLFFGFENIWERNLWKTWMEKAATTELSYRKLDLSDCGLEKIPKTVLSTWVDLEELTLSENRINVEDPSVQVLLESPKLRKLSLSSTCISALPSYINELTKLEYLNVSRNYLVKLPENIVALSSLTDLILDYNEISDIPMLDDFHKLRNLSVAHNCLTNDCSFVQRGMRKDSNEINDKDQFVLRSNLSIVNLKGNSLKGFIKLANYGNLTDLDLSENSIEQLDLSSLSSLKCLKCSKNQLTELIINGSELISCTATNNKLKTLTISPEPLLLQHLDLCFNELKLLPEWVLKCNALQTLAASHNRLTELPEDIFCNENCALNTLQLSFNQLTVLPQVMRRVPIQCLFLQNNSLVTLPRHFFVASSSLKTLNVSKNCLKALPQFISRNEKLEYLYLTSNALTDITPLLNCHRLKTLHVAYNAIGSLPEGCVSAWSCMEELVISGNSLSQIPDNISNWHKLRVFRAHSNLFASTPSFGKNRSLKILDLSNNYLKKIDLGTLIPKQLMYLDISGNSHLHVDSKQFYYYKNQRSLNLVDVSGHNRNSLPFHPSPEEAKNMEFTLPWTLGFSETVGKKDKLHIAQIRLPEFCNSEALIGIFDSVNRAEVSKQFVKAIPRILLEERAVKETASDYMKYTMLSAHRELKEYSWQSEIYCTLCHISKQKEAQDNNQKHRYMLRIASIGDTVTILCRNTGSLTLSHSPEQTSQKRAFNDVTHGSFSPDPHITEIALHDQDQFLLLANRSLWDVMSIEEAVAEVRSVTHPVLAAKRLQDLAQCYGCETNLSVAVLRFHNFHSDHDMMTRDMRFTVRPNKIKITDDYCDCDDNKLMHAEPVISGSNRSSPSGQSDKGAGSRFSHSVYDDNIPPTTYAYRKYSQPLPAKENCIRQDGIFSGSVADGEESYSDKSVMQVSEERFRCWEYMLEQNTQMLFDKELDTLSRNFTKRSVPPRPDLWSPHTKSVSHLPDCIQNAVPFLSKRFGSARSYNNAGSRLDLSRRSLNGGPNAAYFGSLQRLMPYHLEYNFSEIKEKFDNTMDSLEQDSRMHKYWDVATTEL